MSNQMDQVGEKELEQDTMEGVEEGEWTEDGAQTETPGVTNGQPPEPRTWITRISQSSLCCDYLDVMLRDWLIYWLCKCRRMTFSCFCDSRWSLQSTRSLFYFHILRDNKRRMWLLIWRENKVFGHKVNIREKLILSYCAAQPSLFFAYCSLC